MRKSNLFLRKSALLLCVLLLLSSQCFAEKYFQISASELNEIQEQTNQMMTTVETLTESVKMLENQRNKYLTLSNELGKEVESQKKKAQIYKGIAIGACVSSVLLGGALLVTCKN